MFSRRAPCFDRPEDCVGTGRGMEQVATTVHDLATGSRRNPISIWSDVEPAGAPIPAYRIERRSRLAYKEFIQDHVRGNRPVVITDAAASWPALAKWTPAFFSDRFATVDVNVEGRRQSLGAFVDDMKASRFDRPGRYASSSIARQFPSLLDDVNPRPGYWSPNWLESPFLRRLASDHNLTNAAGLEITMAGAGSAFPQIHRHRLQTETFVVQIHGREEWVLYGPDQSPSMYPAAPLSPISQLAVRDGVDLERFPRFRDARPVRFFMDPGEMFYAPPGWWHARRALTPSFALVQTIARGPIWWGVTKSACASALQADGRARPVVYAKAAALFAYLTAFAAARSAVDAFFRR
jgi:histone arginine demethylase JMJD6